VIDLDRIFALPILKNSPLDWALACGVASGLRIASLLVRHAVRRYHRRVLAGERVGMLELVLEILSRTTLLFFIVLAVFTGLNTLGMSPVT